MSDNDPPELDVCDAGPSGQVVSMCPVHKLQHKSRTPAGVTSETWRGVSSYVRSQHQDPSGDCREGLGRLSLLVHTGEFPMGVGHRVINGWGLTKVAVVLLNGLIW